MRNHPCPSPSKNPPGLRKRNEMPAEENTIPGKADHAPETELEHLPKRIRFFAVFGGMGLGRGQPWGMTPEKLFHELSGLGLKWEVVESRFRTGKPDGLFGGPRDTAAVGIGLLSASHRAGLFCYDPPHRNAYLAASSCVPAPLPAHLPAASRQGPAMRPCGCGKCFSRRWTRLRAYPNNPAVCRSADYQSAVGRSVIGKRAD